MRNFNKTFNVVFYGALGFMGVCFVAIFASAIVKLTSGNISIGVNGAFETRCINGYQFVITERETRQVMDELGHGVKCEK
jgi:hypothetical protein